MMELQLNYDGITDGTTMAQASTLVPVTKMKKAQAWTLALSWGKQSRIPTKNSIINISNKFR